MEKGGTAVAGDRRVGVDEVVTTGGQGALVVQSTGAARRLFNMEFHCRRDVIVTAAVSHRSVLTPCFPVIQVS